MPALVRWTLRQRRYVRILSAMALVALGCLAAGSFEVHRYGEKRHDNAALIAAAHAAPVPLASVTPVIDGRRRPDTGALRFRRVTASGRYLTAGQTYVGNVTQGGRQGFYVLTPLRTGSGALLLVARGFIAVVAGTEERPASVPAPPAGVVTVAGRLSPGQTDGDRFGVLGHGEITSVNPVQQSARLDAPVYGAWLTLAGGAAGSNGLDALPPPDLSNPSGGAAQWQLLSYVVQWYAFALLALAAPFLFARAELKDARRRFLGVDDDAVEIDAGLDDGPSALDPAAPRPELETAGGTVARRRGAEVGTVDPSSPRYRQAARLARRYGRSLSIDDPPPDAADDEAAAGPFRRRSMPDADRAVFSPQVRADSRSTPHRSVDAYQGSYNDYLWQLALADGEVPEPELPAALGEDVPTVEPRVIDIDPGESSR